MGVGEVEMIDRVELVTKELERQGIADNTVILFLTDNGYSCGAHGMGGKVLPYEEPSRSPMIIFDPGVNIFTTLTLVLILTYIVLQLTGVYCGRYTQNPC